MAAGFLASMLDDFDACDFASFYHGVLSPALSFLLLNNTGVNPHIECVPHAEVTVNSYRCWCGSGFGCRNLGGSRHHGFSKPWSKCPTLMCMSLIT